jgi:peptide/nickel transport system ATP-binding protein
VSVEVRGLTVQLSGSSRKIVDDVSFRIAPGEVVGLVGESGSGKTTVGTALLGFTRKGARITAGEVRLDGRDVLALSTRELAAVRGSAISYVPQDPGTALNPALRIGRQLGELLEVHRRGLSHAEHERLVAAALGEVRLPSDRDFQRRYPHQLSGGQQQRVCLAMAFILRPGAIVLDEPTTGLDVSTQAHILAAVRELCHAHRVAALYITHDLAIVAGLAQRVLVMLRGELVEQGDCERVLGSPTHPYTVKLVSAVPDIGDHPARDALPAGAESTPSAADLRDEEAALADALAHVEPGQPILAVRNLRCSYGAHEVISGATLTVRQGECLALVGESGSGKTTLSRTVIGLMAPQAGAIELAGRPLRGAARDRPATARRAMQYIFQNPYASLNPRKSIEEILSKPYRHFFGGSKAQAHRSMHEALERVALPSATAAQYPDQLSGGERQRVALARALVCNPRLLICDEVTSALDVSVQAQILELLIALKHDQQLSLLFVTHNLAVVRHVADRVTVLERGVIVEQGQTDDVLDHPQHPYTQQLLRDTPTWRP